jgi:hypothetical protein
MRRVALLLVLGLSSHCYSQGTAVAPTALNGVEGAGFYIFNGPITFQQVYAPAQLVGLLPGSIITGMQLRLNSTFLESPASTVTNFDVALGPSNFAPGSLSNSVAGNQGAGTVQVRTGNVSFAENAYSFGSSPNGWGPVIPFSSSFTYQGGDLLLTVTHTAPSSELDFDVGSGLTGVQYYQAQLYNATTLTDSEIGNAIAVQFSFIAVPEPATWYALGIICLSLGTVGSRKWLKKRQQEAIVQIR